MKYILLTGHRKSGTTLLHRLFDAHPELNIYPVDLSLLYAFYPKWVKPSFMTSNEAKERFDLVVMKSTMEIHGKSLSSHIKCFDPVEFLSFFWSRNNIFDLSTASAIISSLANCYCDYLGLDKSKPFLFKETSQAINFQSFIDSGLDIQALQIIRDPRDNFASIKSGHSDYYKAMNEGYYKSLSSTLNRCRIDLELAKVLGKRYEYKFFVIKFEELVECTSKSLKKILPSLNLAWFDSLLSPTDLGKKYHGNNYEGLSFDGISKINTGRWSERILQSEAALIEAWMGPIMAEWGYIPHSDVSQQLEALQYFYDWYNTSYFYSDSFTSQQAND